MAPSAPSLRHPTNLQLQRYFHFICTCSLLVMSGFHNKPYLLKKEQLKRELMDNGIPLPKADQRKDFYVNLYKEHFSLQEDDPSSVDEFSSDDEDTPGSSPMGARKKLPPTMPSKVLISQKVKGLPFDVAALSDGDLARQLKQFGGTVGPITESTRHLYQKKLERLLTEECKQTFTGVPHKKTFPSRSRREEFLADLSDANDEIDQDEQKVQTLTNQSVNDKQQVQDAVDNQPMKETPFAERSNGMKYSLRKRPVSDIESAKQSTGQSSTGNLAGSTGNIKEIQKVTNPKTKKNPKQDKNDKHRLSPWVKLIGCLLCFALFTAFLMYFLWRKKYLAINYLG